MEHTTAGGPTDWSDSSDAAAPRAQAGRGTVRELHGVTWEDEYSWMRDIDDPHTQRYLRDERAYYEARTAHTRSLQRTMFDEMSSRCLPSDRSVSWSRGGLVYYTRTVAGKEYQQFLRLPAEDSPAELLLDENDLAEGSEYFALGIREPSPDGALLAYSVDLEGDEVYELRFRDLASGKDLPETVARTYYGGAWSADSAHFFYVVHDHVYRPYQVWRHEMGTDPADDALVLQEDDERFEVICRGTRSAGFVQIRTDSKSSSEVWLVPADRPLAQPVVVSARAPGVLYSVDHAPTPDGDVLVIVTDDGAPEFRLVRAPVGATGRDTWEELVGQDPRERLGDPEVFARHVVLPVRRDAATLLRVLRRDGSQDALDLHPGLEAGSIRLGTNEEFDTGTVTVVVESYTEPPAWYSVDLDTGERTLLKRLEVPGYDPGRYVSERYAVEGRDGELVPVTIARHADVPLDGTAPCLLFGYGAYEWSYDPEFEVALPSLLDRGVVFAHAHVRGGGEGGRRWWLDGSLQHKQNTFDDFVAVAEGIDGLVDGDRIVGRGLSAGGLLMGAVFSQAPARWRGVVAEVPFVDVVNTMLDGSLPLTAQEWEEWGDPRRPEDFAWMRAYSPYDNLPPARVRPRMLVTGAVHDPRVMYGEPAKWVARMRADGSTDDRLLLRMELGAGAHVGPSGRFGHLAYEAEVYAWVLDTVGLSASR